MAQGLLPWALASQPISKAISRVRRRRLLANLLLAKAINTARRGGVTALRRYGGCGATATGSRTHPSPHPPACVTKACCLFSDDYEHSGDSDQDLITDYLSPEAGVGAVAGGSVRLMAAPHGQPHGQPHGLMPMMHAPGPLLPTISVTPHSPGGKHYAVLG